MSRKVASTLRNVVLLSSLMMVLVSATAFAGGIVQSGPFRYVAVSTFLGPPAPELPCFKTSAFDATNKNLACTSDDGGGNFASAHGIANANNAKVVEQTNGTGHAGRFGTMSAVPSTSDSFDISHSTTGANQVTFTLVGNMFLDPSTVDPKQAAQSLTVSVYPNTAAAQAGTGALWRGAIHVSGNRDLSQARTSGQFTDADFIKTPGAGNTLTVNTAPGLTKVVNGVPDPAQAIVEMKAESASLSMPGLSPVGLILLTALLAAAGFYVLPRRKGEAAA